MSNTTNPTDVRFELRSSRYPRHNSLRFGPVGAKSARWASITAYRQMREAGIDRNQAHYLVWNLAFSSTLVAPEFVPVDPSSR